MAITFTRVHHQFSLFDFDQLKPKTKIPMKRISKERLESAKAEWMKGNKKPTHEMLSDINDALERYLNRLK